MSSAIVVALYVFIGNSGVISFGQMSFVAVGAFLSGILTIDAQQKSFVLPNLFPILRDTHVGTPLSLVLAALAGGVYALLVGLVLMRLSGLPAGIATFAVLGITYNVFRNWEKIGPGRAGAQLGPREHDLGADGRRPDLGRGRVRLPAQPFRPPAPRDARGPRGRAGERDRRLPPAARRVHPQRRARGLRGGPAGARARQHHDRSGLPRAHLRHARDARGRRASAVSGARWSARSSSAASTPSSATPRTRRAYRRSGSRCPRARGSSCSARSWRSC